MAFPVNGVVDNFNTGASQNLTARAGWGASVINSAGTTYATDGTPTTATHGTGPGSNYWNTSSADAESWATLSTWTPASDTLEICARITAVGASPTYYAVILAVSGTTDFQIYKVVAGAYTAIGSNVATTVAAGDSVGISVIGSQVTSYYKSGAGAWTQKDTVSDSAITGSAFVAGFVKENFSATNAFTDFGGGSLDPANPVVSMIRGGDRHTPGFA